MSPRLTGPYCLRMHYHMLGTSMGSLKVHKRSGSSSSVVFTINGNQGSQWYMAQTSLTGPEQFQVMTKKVHAVKFAVGETSIVCIHFALALSLFSLAECIQLIYTGHRIMTSCLQALRFMHAIVASHLQTLRMYTCSNDVMNACHASPALLATTEKKWQDSIIRRKNSLC